MTVAAELEATIRPIFERAFGPFGGGTVSLRFGEDHDGDPAVFVDVKVNGDGVSLPDDVVERNQSFITDVRGALRAAGETRYPYVLIDFRYMEDAVTDFGPARKGRPS